MIQNRNRKRDTRSGLERELNLMVENAAKAGLKQQCCETRGIKQGPNGRLDFNVLCAPVHQVAERVARLRITA